MKNRKHGWLVAVFLSGELGAAYEVFCKSESKAEQEAARAYREHNDIENVTIDEVLYDPITEKYEAI